LEAASVGGLLLNREHDVCLWHITAFAAPQHFGRYRTRADNGRRWR
jgi:hypothetical protein